MMRVPPHIMKRYLTPPVLALFAANATPIAGVVLLGWDVLPVVLLFWMENVIVGAVNVLKMACVAPCDPVLWIGKLFLIPFFCVHYGLFCWIHGSLVIAFFGGGAMPRAVSLTLPALFRFIAANRLEWAVASLAASHLLSFMWNFLWLGEYRRAGLNDLMAQPYARVVVLHLAVLFGGFVVIAVHSSAGALVLLVALKTALDARAHLKERGRFGEPRTSQPQPAPTRTAGTA